MAKTKAEDPKAIRPGDFLHLTVPPNRYIAVGCHRARVESLAPKERFHDSRSYNCSVVINDTEFEDTDAIYVLFRLTIYNHPALSAKCFIGPDEFPVGYVHEPNLERRLRDSLPPERLPYADD